MSETDRASVEKLTTFEAAALIKTLQDQLKVAIESLERIELIGDNKAGVLATNALARIREMGET